MCDIKLPKFVIVIPLQELQMKLNSLSISFCIGI